MGSSIGKIFKVTTFGESHGKQVGCVVENCPAGMSLSESDIQHELDRRRPGQNRMTTPRQEEDKVEIVSGVFQGKTLGTPIALIVKNENAREHDYDELKDIYRPSHGDYTYDARYGHRAYVGGGRASARTTLSIVAAGAIARKLLAEKLNIEIVAWVARVEDIALPSNFLLPTIEELRQTIEANDIRCPHFETAQSMMERVKEAKKDRDSLGGLIELQAENVPPGLGDPVFDRLDADLAKIMMAIPASKSVEIGSGLQGTFLRGSVHNDPFVAEKNKVATLSNNSGGIQAGISNGQPIQLRVGFKPTPTIGKEQTTIDKNLQEKILKAKGRHDPCVLPRAVPIVEAATALVLADHFLRLHSIRYETLFKNQITEE